MNTVLADERFNVVPIVGMGGVGKTTLARLLYNDMKVKDHFKIRVWVCVSGEFDILKISKSIFEYVLSYNDLTACLKRLFAYCSLFPKDYLFDKEDLVLLWMAEGFLHQPIANTSTIERLGHDYFEELLSRSFFQHAPNEESLFVMHDLMNDLATSVVGEFFMRLDNELKKGVRKDVLENYRIRNRFIARGEHGSRFDSVTDLQNRECSSSEGDIREIAVVCSVSGAGKFNAVVCTFAGICSEIDIAIAVADQFSSISFDSSKSSNSFDFISD